MRLQGRVLAIYVAKATRVFSFGIVSIITPVYLSILGYSSFQVGLSVAAIVLGNIVSNLLLTWLEPRFGARKIILLFSLTMFVSGIVFSFETYFLALIIACVLGNISTTGTEAGPFQSFETAVIPEVVGEENAAKTYGAYNVVGYVFSSIGAFAASIPSYFSNTMSAFKMLYLLYAVNGLFLLFVYTIIDVEKKARQATKVNKRNNKEVIVLSALFFTDSFGGGFVTQSLLSYWFYTVYSVSLSSLGFIFLFSNVITAISTYAAPFVARRIGNLRTMVYTHVLSNFFLIAVPLSGSLFASVLFLFLRQSLSQMDVPTRQAFMLQIFEKEERVYAIAVTNTARNFATLAGGPVTGFLLASGIFQLPIVIGGTVKLAYDLAIYLIYRKRVK